MDNDEVLFSCMGDVYFDSNVLVDGDGSENNPYKNLNSTSLRNCSIAHLKSGEYILSEVICISKDIEFIGENSNNTFMKNVKIINNQSFYTVSFKNIAVVNPQILNYGILNIENSKFTSFNCVDSVVYSQKFSNLNLNSQINIDNSIFYNLKSNGNFINTNHSDVSIFNSYFYNNSAGYNGVISSINSNLIINNSTFLNNNAFKEGGVIYVSESLMDINNSLFVNSSASFGGAVCNLKSKTDIKNSKFINNTAIYDGGAIYNMYSTLNLTRTIFNNNSPSGLFLDNSTSNICFSNFSQTTIERSYENNFNIDNNSIYGDIFYSDLSLERISGVPIYCGNYSISVNDLPDCYDGREHNLNTSVKNQDSGGNCWAFASLATLESCILKTNNQSIFDFSEENMKNVIARFSDYGLNIITNNGGNINTVQSYLSSWLGPVLDVDDVYCPTSTLSPILDSCMHVQNIYYIPFNKDLVKEAVYKYGSVYYGFLYSANYLNSSNYNYNGSNTTNMRGHAVSIIGWDDNYSRENFKFKPKNDGAWIVKNSWGSTPQDDGYWYISYENNNETRDYVTFFTFILNDTNNYNHNYQYDIAYTDWKNNLENIYYSNNFTSSQNEILSAVSTYFLTSPVFYEISIKINNVVNHTQWGFMESCGYYTIPLTKQLVLNKNDKFEVIFHLYAYNQVYAPFCNDRDITHILYPSNSSRYSFDSIAWETLNDGVFCIKAFTILNKTKINITQLNDTAYTKNNQNQIFFQILDNNGSNVTRGKLILNIDNNNYTANVVNGIAEFNNVLLSHTGSFNCSAFYIDNVLYENSNITCSITNKEFLDVNLTLINPYYGQIQKIKIKIPENRQITLQFNNTPILINETKIIELRILNKGNHSILICYDEDNYYIDANVFNFTVLNETYLLIADNLTKYYHGSERYYVTLTHTLNQSVTNKSITIEINRANYTRTTDANGTVSIAINLHSGQYTATARYNEINITNQITVKTTVNGTDVVKMFRNATQYYATFLDSNGNYLADGTVVQFNINGVMYDRRVLGDKGLAKLNINLEQGKYVITAMNPVTGENTANNITVLSLLVENRDITKYYKNATQYTVKVLGENGNPVGADVTVKFNINGVFYERHTNESSIAKLNINLQPGDYIITVEYNGCMISNNIKVLPILTASDLIKKYGTADQFVATLVDGQGKPYEGQNITFNINGVFYKRLTDNNGEAKLNINLMPGEYIITSSYDSTSIANRIKITA